jgi:hypothetical protein
MFLILLSILLAATAVAISMIRRLISGGNLARSGIAREDIPIAKGRAGQFSPMKQFLVVVLPDGKIVDPRGSGPVINARLF